MKRFFVAVAAAVALLASAPAIPARAAVPYVRVMPLGDSITAGVGGTTGGGYRLPLWTIGQDQFTIDFVGSQRNGTFADPDNEGHSGYFIDDIRLGRAAGEGVDAWLAAHQPDVVLLHIGINDLDHGTDKAHAVDRLATLVGQIFADRPGITVVLAGLIPASAGLADLVNQFNAGAREIEAAQQRLGHHLRYVDMPLQTSDLADRLHPNNGGYAKMAEIFRGALDDAFAVGWIHGSTPPAGSAPESSSKVRWADFDGDGRSDYLVIDPDGSVDAWLNRGGDGHGGWQAYGQVAVGLTSDRDRVRFADFDGDGRADYVLFADSGAVSVWLNRGGDGHGGWQAYGQVAVGLTSDRDRVRFADFDGDGRADYVLFADSGAVSVWLNRGGDGHGGWQAYGQVAVGLTSDRDRVRFADFNGDRRNDYLVINPNGSVDAWLNRGGDGHGGWQAYGQVATGLTGNAEQVRLTDFDGDGRVDYVLMNLDGSVDARLNRGGDSHGGWADDGQIATGVVRE